ncbi:MAG TPA: outer membrane beta-barrel protein, partial [Puia sp.]|nr:outer membrane beta-barrel protein [Puia sp.]
ADSFKVQPNATIEDLLKKLPGIQVDKNGQITAQGETVQKVLVDGEEFFGDDPTLVTKNLRADMVDKVQVYDKKSDQAAFTGIDDGQKQKTINFKLKEDKKNGYFGKLSAGAATDGYHDSQLMFNKFQKKEKISLYGIVSNTGTAGLNWQDQNAYGGSNGVISVDANGNIIGSDDISGWDGNYSGQGYPLVQTGGVHYNNKWDNDNQSMNGNYKIMQLFVNGNSATNSEYILPDSTTSYYQNQTQKFRNQVMRNKLFGTYEFQIDSSSSIKFTADGTLVHKITNDSSSTQSLLVYDSARLNNGTSKTSTEGDNNSFNSELLWKKKFKKKGRTISVDAIENYMSTTSNGYLFSANDFYTNDSLSLAQVTDQYKTNTGKTFSLTTNATYTEPLSAISSLIFNYGVIINNSSADKLSYNKSQTGKYDSLDNIYSSDYSFNMFTQKGGLAYSLVKKKLRFGIGSDAGYSNFKQNDLFADTTGKRSFVNWYPHANFSYDLATQNSIYISYNGSTVQPTLQQIQPIQNNQDPLNIVVGNAALKPAFQNNIRMQYYFFKALTNNNLFTNFNYGFTENAISTNSYVDTLGRRITQSINVSGNYTLSANINYGFKWKQPDIYFGPRINISKNRNNSVVNNERNITNSNDYTFGFYMGKYKEKKIDCSFRASATYTNSTSSIQTGFATKYWSYNLHPDLDFFLPLKLQIHTDLDYTFRQRTSVFDNNNNITFWNAWFGKKLLKGDQLLIKVSANDILNQNKGITRNVSSNFISQQTYSTIQRFYMLSVVWNFTKAGTAAPTGGGMMIVN